MRITNKMTITNTLENIQQNQSKMEKTNNMLTSGKRITLPQDDPSGAVKSMGYRGNLQEISQYLNNVSIGKNMVTATDAALDETTGILSRARELAVKGANGVNDTSSLDAISNEISQMIEQMYQVSNSKVGQRYIFGGLKTTNIPFKSFTGETDISAVPPGPGQDLVDINGNQRTGINATNITTVSYSGDNGRIKLEMSENITTEINISGQEIFTNPNGQNLFKTMIELRDSLLKGDFDGIEESIGKIDKGVDQVLKYRAEVGAKMNRFDQTETKLNNLNISITDLLSKTEDTDFTKAIMDLKTQETVQKMALSVGAKVIQPTLVDFLR